MLKALTKTDHKVFTLQCFEELGWQINKEKCQLTPGHRATFVGFDITIIGPQGSWIRVLPQKIRKLRRSIVQILNKQYVSACSLVRVSGQCIAMTKAVLPAKLLLRNIYRCLARTLDWDSQGWWLMYSKNTFRQGVCNDGGSHVKMSSICAVPLGIV